MNFYSSNFVGWDILNGSPCMKGCSQISTQAPKSAGAETEVSCRQSEPEIRDFFGAVASTPVLELLSRSQPLGWRRYHLLKVRSLVENVSFKYNNIFFWNFAPHFSPAPELGAAADRAERP